MIGKERKEKNERGIFPMAGLLPYQCYSENLTDVYDTVFGVDAYFMIRGG